MRCLYPLLIAAMVTAHVTAEGKTPLPPAFGALADKCELIVVGTLMDYETGGWSGSGPIMHPGVSRTVTVMNRGTIEIQAVLKGAKPTSHSLPILMPAKGIFTMAADAPLKTNTAATPSPKTPGKENGVGSSHVFFLRRHDGEFRITSNDTVTGRLLSETVYVWETVDDSRPLYPSEPKLIEALKLHLLHP